MIFKSYKIWYPWVIWSLAASFFFYKYLVQVSPSVMTEELMHTFQVNAAGLGNLSAFYFYAYLLMQIPVGMMLDRYSPRIITALAILLCSVSTLGFAHTDHLWLACLMRALMGAGAAFAAVSCFKFASMWFPAKRFAFITGLFMTAAMLGAVGGQMPLSQLVQSLGWREALNAIGVIGIIFSVIYYLLVRDKPSSTCDMISHECSIFKQLWNIVTNPQAIILSIYSGLAFAPVSVFGGLWGVPFLKVAYHLSRNDAAFAVSCVFIGFAAGAPFWGWLSDYIGRRKPVLLLGTASALICLWAVVGYHQWSYATLILLLFVFGFGASGFFTCFAMIKEIFSMLVVATVLGWMNTFDALCEALYEPLIGAVMDYTWTGEIVDGVRQYSLENYYIALSLLVLSLGAALVMVFFIKETYCQSVRTPS
ncbi:MAG: MFS transporter [Legionellaceae bacterium]|nr:MFS transporter [Legionellaceae bacterium]